MEDQIRHYEDKLRFEIDAADLMQAVNEKQNIVIVDARKPEAYQAERIPGAINLPHREMDERTVEILDKEATYVAYCDGVGCNASTKGALKLARLGFTVRELIGGLDWWKRDGYPTQTERSATGIGCAC